MKRSRVSSEQELEVTKDVPMVDAMAIQSAIQADDSAAVPLKLGEFLKKCFYCKKSMSDDKEVYMYRDFCAYCSIACREAQMLFDSKVLERQAAKAKARENQQRGVGDSNCPFFTIN